MKIKDRLNKLAEAGLITPHAVDEAQKKGWITAKEKTAMRKVAEDKLPERAKR